MPYRPNSLTSPLHHFPKRAKHIRSQASRLRQSNWKNCIECTRKKEGVIKNNKKEELLEDSDRKRKIKEEDSPADTGLRKAQRIGDSAQDTEVGTVINFKAFTFSYHPGFSMDREQFKEAVEANCRLDQKIKKEFEGSCKAFCYLLLDPKILGEDVENLEIGAFLGSIFYVGKGSSSRPLQHFKDVLKARKKDATKLLRSPKMAKIDELWREGLGVPKHEFFHGCSHDEACVREACIIFMLQKIQGNQLANIKSFRHLQNRRHPLCLRNQFAIRAKRSQHQGPGSSHHPGFFLDLKNYEGTVEQNRLLDQLIREEFAGSCKSFCYILMDPRFLGTDSSTMGKFLSSIFYIGKRTGIRPLHHLIEARDARKNDPQKVLSSEKLTKIDQQWSLGFGVTKHGCFHGCSDEEAFVREACMIHMLRKLEGYQLTNVQPGSMKGSTSKWDGPTKYFFGYSLLEKALAILKIEGIRLVFESSLPGRKYFANSFLLASIDQNMKTISDISNSMSSYSIKDQAKI